ncbi:unnamed protein product [Rotaria socialis]|uniref:TIR domain-containing protein n=3 Tax=Rotaria socialis TaxID=392032 RepID=A0A821G0L6_9BILA|nr:unnamed protein product [Rotaria socialis]CAF4657191.1 unnamed protein product [Rotaria socialis]
MTDEKTTEITQSTSTDTEKTKTGEKTETGEKIDTGEKNETGEKTEADKKIETDDKTEAGVKTETGEKPETGEKTKTDEKIETDEKTEAGEKPEKTTPQNSSTTACDKRFQQDPIFQKHLPKGLCSVLKCWLSNDTIDTDQKEIFRSSTEFLLQSTKTDPDAKEWINQETELIDLTDKCLQNIASDGHHLGTDDSKDPNLQLFDCLIQAFQHAQCKQLADSLIKCITSHYYIDAVRSLNDPIATSLNTTQEFLLVTCPKYIVLCDKTKSYSSKISNEILNQFNEALTELLPNVEKWTAPVMFCLVYPLKFILPQIRSSSYERRKPLYDIVLNLNLHLPDSDPTNEEARNKLIYVLLCVLIEIVRSDRKLSNQLKNETEEKADLVKILVSLSKIENGNGNNEQINLKAVELISLLVPEDELLKENSTEKVTALFIKNFNAAVRSGNVDKADAALKGFKDLIQNDDVKEEVMKQDALPSIIKFAKESIDDPLPLEVVYSMAFNKDGNKVIREDKEFVDHVKELLDAEIQEVAKIAHGIMWKIEGEQKFEQRKLEKMKKKEDEKNQKKDEKSEKTDDAKPAAPTDNTAEKEPDQYHMMISYCWAQQPLCHRINDRLEKDGYKVWLDRDEMRGSIIESMAEAIENSKFVLLCMSSNYKKSINCKAEAEYAFNQHSKIIPLIVEPKYKADGWLGFMAGSKIYVDFADKEDEEFEKAYNLLIEELKRNGLDDKDEDQEKKADQTGTNTASKKEDSKKSEESEKKEDSKKSEESEKKEDSKKSEESEEKEEPNKKEEAKKSVESEKTEMPQKPEKVAIQTRQYLNIPEASMWSNQHVLEFLIDKKLDPLIPICESMDGEALIEFHESCKTMPDIRDILLKGSNEQQAVPLGTLFNFISKLNKSLPPKPGRKVYFQYRYVSPPASPTETVGTNAENIS